MFLEMIKSIFSRASKREKWEILWEDNEKFIQARHEKFNILDKYITESPKRLLDIGCGLAIESECFQQKYATELYLLDGDSQINDPNQSRDIGFGPVEDMQFYLKKEFLEQAWLKRGMQFVFVEANEPNIGKDIKFDLIYSFKSCGFHYPLGIYSRLIEKHSHSETRLIFDLRKGVDQGEVSYEIVKSLISWEKGITAEIRLI